MIHTLVLVCEAADGRAVQSRLALVDAGDETHDYGLTSAHSLLNAADCTVADDGYNRVDVEGFRLAPGYDPEDVGSVFRDWGVVRVNRLDRPGLVRFPLDDIVDDPATVTTAYIPKGRGLLVNPKPCAITFRDVRVPPVGKRTSYPTHGCRTQGGQSGTPMTVGEGPETQRLFGILTGRTFLYPDIDTKTGSPAPGDPPRWYGRFVPVDGVLAAEIRSEVRALKAAS